MKTLVIIPTNIFDCSFSAPVCWLFSKHTNNTKGIYGFELTKDYVQNYESFILELNWFTELEEFIRIVNFIKLHNKDSKILFAGLYAALKYKEIFKKFDVDYYIKGDNELPIQQYLDGVSPEKIPNFVGKNFENSIDYRFEEKNYLDLEFNLDWFPSYFKYNDPMSPFQLPMLHTVKGGCTTIHKECQFCMGSKHKQLMEIYDRKPVVMSNKSLIHQLQKIDEKFDKASLEIMSEFKYDFSNIHFDLDVTIEVDGKISHNQLKNMLHAFKKCSAFLPVYEEGISGEILRNDLDKFLQVEDSNHKIMFYISQKDMQGITIPPDHLIPTEVAYPAWAQWDYYMDFDKALEFSKKFYNCCKRHFVDGTPTSEEKNPTIFEFFKLLY